eukprot:TRINITY_DN5349_c1_g1_i1.p1 TRINITY_DN5349_c1_g1~~TRINITY_DN5349_c1_g1_i1.p1  ORF type:complete len:487 (+),score=162.72 TRINITY_DN5349_c1_g1_i1:114-1463(+)
MSGFDAAVLDWVKRSSIPPEKKCSVLDSAKRGIQAYQNLSGQSKPRVAIDESLVEQIDKERERALRGEIFQDPVPAAQQDGEKSPGGFRAFRFGGEETMSPEPESEEDDEDAQETTEHDDSQHAAFSQQYQGLQRKGSGQKGAGGKSAYAGGRRKTVSSEVINLENIAGYEPPRHPKDPQDTAWLREQLQHEWLFEHLEDHELDQLIDAFEFKEVYQGENLFTEGEEGDTFYILQEGDVVVTEEGEEVDSGSGPGWKRGEEDLMYGHEAYQTVTVASPSARVFGLQREPYRYMVTKASIKKRAMYGEFLSKIFFLKDMNIFERNQVADALKSVTFHQGEHLISFGDEGSAFYIIVEGAVKVVGRDGDHADDPKKDVCEFQTGDCVGELEFVHGHRCVADVIAVTPVVRTAKMGKRHFEKVMGTCEDVLKQRAAEDPKFAYYRTTGKAGS